VRKHNVITSDPTSELDHQLRLLEWKYRDYLQQRRVAMLRDRLRNGRQLSVYRTDFSFSRYTIVLHLDSGWDIKLRLHRPVSRPFATISTVRWSHAVSWVVEGTEIDDSPIRCYAWRITMTFAGT
jgi:hypothetical protein